MKERKKEKEKDGYVKRDYEAQDSYEKDGVQGTRSEYEAKTYSHKE